MLSCSAIDLAKIRRSSKISSWIWSIISDVVTAFDRPVRGASQVEKITTFKLDHPVFDGGLRWCIFPLCFFQNSVNFLRRLALQKKNWWQFASRCCWNRERRLTCFLSALVTRKDLQFGTWTDPLFPTTLSIPSYNIGKYVELRNYHPPSYRLHGNTAYFLMIHMLHTNPTGTFGISEESFLMLHMFTLLQIREKFLSKRIHSRQQN